MNFIPKLKYFYKNGLNIWITEDCFSFGEPEDSFFGEVNKCKSCLKYFFPWNIFLPVVKVVLPGNCCTGLLTVLVVVLAIGTVCAMFILIVEDFRFFIPLRNSNYFFLKLKKSPKYSFSIEKKKLLAVSLFWKAEYCFKYCESKPGGDGFWNLKIC